MRQACTVSGVECMKDGDHTRFENVPSFMRRESYVLLPAESGLF